MKIKTLEQDKNRITLLIESAEVQIVNALRRTIFRSVPTMAVEDVDFFKNSSPFYDEVLALRLGLIPLTTDYSYSLKSECKCKGAGCSRCQVILGVNKKGPGYVYASDITTSDPKVKPVEPKTVIAYLDEGQELNFEAKAELGVGSAHSKWCPGLASYRFYPKMKVGKSKTLIETCPKHALVLEDGKVVVSKKNLEECAACKACAKAGEDGDVSVEADRSRILFTFESWGQLPVETVFDKALTVLDEQVKELKQ